MKRLADLLWLAVFAGLLVYLAFTIWLAWSGLTYPYQLDYGEGPLLEQARLLSQGQSIYKGLEGYPYSFSNYPPLLQTLSALLIPILGVSYTAGRLWNVLAVFLLGMLLYRVVQGESGNRRAAAIASLAFVGSPYIYHWAPLFRTDLPALLFSILGIVVLAYDPRSGVQPRRSASQVYVAAILFTLSLYTKHSLLAAPAAALIYLGMQRRGDALRLLATMLLLGGGLFLLLDYQTAGAFYFDLVTTNVNPFNLAGLLSQAWEFSTTFAVILALAIYAFLARLADRRRQTAEHLLSTTVAHSLFRLFSSMPLWDLYLVAAVAAVALAGKVGSWENYFFEALLVLCIYTGWGLSRAVAEASRLTHPSVPLVVPLAMLLQVALMFHTPAVAATMMHDDNIANQRLSSILAGTPGPILSEDMGLLVTNGREIGFFGFEYTQLARMGLWDQAWELGMLREGRFPLVILEAGTREDADRYHRFTRQVLSELDHHYALTEEIGKYRLYRPSPLRRELAGDFAGQIHLVGYRVEQNHQPNITLLQPGETLEVSLLWQARRPMTESYTVFVHLLDAQGRGWAQHDGVPFDGIYSTTRWTEGEMVRDTHVLTVPASLPAGRYLLRVGLYASATGNRLRLSSGSDSLAVAALRVGEPAPAYQPTYPTTARLGDMVLLLGYDVGPLQGSPPQVPVTLYWQTQGYLDRDYTVFVHLLDANSKAVAQHDGQPQANGYPTSLWEPGETIADEHLVTIPAGTPPGEYRLAVGLYLLAFGERLPVASGGTQAILGNVRVP